MLCAVIAAVLATSSAALVTPIAPIVDDDCKWRGNLNGSVLQQPSHLT
jgi:methenyltetrahydromethanopterin cyclohydrolase